MYGAPSTNERQSRKPNEILDEIHAYQGKLTIQEVEEQIQKIILRSNLAISQATRQIPSALLEKKRNLLPHFQQK